MIPVYFDCEFTELSRRGTLISIGLIDEWSHTFYAEFTDYDDDHLSDWVKENVIAKLKLADGTFNRVIATDDNVPDIEMCGDSEKIKKALGLWFQEILLHNYKVHGSEEQIQFHTDCYAYDWMLFCELMWGNGFDIPVTFSYIPIDLSTALWADNIDPDYSREKYAGVLPDDDAEKHNSLWDAKIIRRCFYELRGEIPREE